MVCVLTLDNIIAFYFVPDIADSDGRIEEKWNCL